MLIEIKTILVKVKTWGIGGVKNYLKDALHRRQIQRRLLQDARMHPYPTRERGITLIGMFTQGASHGKVVRDFALALKKAGVPMQTLNTDPHPNIPPEDVKDIITPDDEFHIRRFDHVIEILPSIIPARLKIESTRIAFWEFESGFLHAYPDMPLYRRVIAMSDFNAAYFARELPKTTHVDKILYAFHAQAPSDTPKAEIRARYGVGADDFFVFFNFDFGSSYYRKNPEGAMMAFAKAFPNERNARLVFKTMRAKTRPDLLARIKSLAIDLGIVDRITMIHSYIPEQDIFDLTNASDVYLSLHRGEGFGITLAEAMAMGKPVICTNWSSTTEFCKPDCTIPIPFKIRALKPEEVDHPYYLKVKEWAEPDVDAAAAALRRLYENPALRSEIGEKARASITAQFSTEAFRRSVDAFLDS